MTPTEALTLIDRADALRRASDLDLLLFFVRHPRSFLTSESLARVLGYDLAQIAQSLDLLLVAGLITRTQTAAHAARLYFFAADGPQPEWLTPVVQAASTRTGRLALMQALRGEPRPRAT